MVDGPNGGEDTAKIKMQMRFKQAPHCSISCFVVSVGPCIRCVMVRASPSDAQSYKNGRTVW